jgi:hypothetical protein
MGNSNENAIDAGSGELVVRVQDSSSNWVSGRLSPTEMKAYVPVVSGPTEYTSYEVLVGTTGCVNEWVIVETIADMAGIQAVDSGSGAFVSRGAHDGYVFGGSTSADGIMQVNYNGANHEVPLPFEVLTASFPALDAMVSDYTFLSDDLVDLEDRGVLRLIGMEQIESLSSDIISTKHTIRHTQSIEEFYEVSEENSWNGVQSVANTLLLWFGSPIIIGQFDVTVSAAINTNRNRRARCHYRADDFKRK